MRNYFSLTLAILIIFSVNELFSEKITIEIPIVKNGATLTDTLDNGDIVTVDVSSDDAEQENDEMDALFDDDIDAGWEGEPGDFNVLNAGFRFQKIPIPQGAKINNAYIEVTSHEAKTTDDVANITIIGEATDDAETFTFDALITDRPETDAKVNWKVDEEWGLWTKHQTADISPIVQELVDRPGWNPGNSMAFILKGEDQGPSEVENAREMEAFENISDPEDGGDGQNHPDRVPVLVIDYSISSNSDGYLDIPIVKNGATLTDTLDNGDIVTVDVSSDDAEQENDEMDALFDDDIDAGWEGEPGDFNVLNAGFRFQNIGLKQGTKIDSAFIIVTSHEAKTTDDIADIIIAGEASDDAKTFTFDALITDRPETEAKVNWLVDEEWGLWTQHKTADISPIVQELVNRPGWEAGNSMAFIFKGKDQGPSEVENAREMEAFENISDPEDGGDGQNHPDRVPRLRIYFQKGTSVNDAAVNNSQLDIYPNPVENGYLDISFEFMPGAQIFVYDQSGKPVKQVTPNLSNSYKLNVSDLTSGVYILEVTDQESTYTEKFIVK